MNTTNTRIATIAKGLHILAIITTAARRRERRKHRDPKGIPRLEEKGGCVPGLWQRGRLYDGGKNVLRRMRRERPAAQRGSQKMPRSCLYARLEHGWSIENALLTPSKKGRSA